MDFIRKKKSGSLKIFGRTNYIEKNYYDSDRKLQRFFSNTETIQLFTPFTQSEGGGILFRKVRVRNIVLFRSNLKKLELHAGGENIKFHSLARNSYG
jgi:hypothetical protein